MLAKKLTTAGPLFVATLIACESSSSQYDGPRTTECSKGSPAQTIPTGQPVQDGEVPDCVPRCGADRKFTYVGVSAYSTEALPSGACAHEGEVCGMAAGRPSPCPDIDPGICNYSGFQCRCEGGSWRCATISQGAGTCVCARDGSAPP